MAEHWKPIPLMRDTPPLTQGPLVVLADFETNMLLLQVADIQVHLTAEKARDVAAALLHGAAELDGPVQ